MLFRAVVLTVALLCLFTVAGPSYCGTIESRYATIVYDNDSLLKEFNSGVRLGSLSFLMRNRSSLTLSDEVGNKVDIIAEKVQMVLEMYPKTLKFRVVLLASASEVRRMYKSRYGREVDFISFYSPGDKAVYISTDDVNLRIFSHELAHAVIDQYFKVSPAVKIHELLAKFAESHIED